MNLVSNQVCFWNIPQKYIKRWLIFFFICNPLHLVLRLSSLNAEVSLMIMTYFRAKIQSLKQANSLFFIVGFAILLMAYVLSLPNRKPHIDDAWLGEHSYWLFQDGVAKSKLMSGIAGSEDRLLLHHKLFTVQGAGIISVFGFSLQWLKAVSLVYLALALAMLWILQHRMHLFKNNQSWMLVLLILLANPLIFEFSFVFRPETMLMFLGLLSFFLLWLLLTNDEHTRLYAFFGGFVAGIALVSHLNGAVFISAGFLLLVFKMKFKPAALFAVGAIFASLGYFYDFRSLSDFSLWYQQLTFIPSDSPHTNPFIKILLNSLGEHMRFFHSPKEISLTLLFIAAAISARKELIKKHNLLVFYTLLLMISMAVLALNKTSKYLIFLLPFITLIIGIAFDRFNTKKSKTRLTPLTVLLSVYFLVSVFYNVNIIRSKYDPTLNNKIRMAFAAENSNDMIVLAPMEFIFDEIDNFKEIHSLMSFNERLKITPNLRSDKFLETAAYEDIDLILLNDEYANVFLMQNFKLHDINAGYRLVYKDSQLMVWKKELSNQNPLTYNSLNTWYSDGLLKYFSALD
jgi:hypothetical protein